MNLADLPPEVLDLILSTKQTSFCVISLWKCGDKRLNWSMANGGVTHMELEGQSGRPTLRLPRMLSQLRFLRHLEIYCYDQSLGGPEELSLSLQRLSPRLEVLRLASLEGETAFLRPTELYLSELFDKGSFEHRTRTWNIGSAFPNLHTLAIYSGPHAFDHADIAALPSTLTSLDLVTSGDFVLADDLPRSLTRLQAKVDLNSENALRALPPNLTSLYLQYASLPDTVFKHLPRSLKTLYPLMDCRMEEELLKTLPPTLETLLLNTFDPGAIHLLPPGLRSLRFTKVARSSVVWNSTLLRALPAGLTAVDSGEADWKSISHDDWPASLKKLDLHCQRQLTPIEVAKLPRTLTDLEVSQHYEGSFSKDACLAALPPLLTRLDIVFDHYSPTPLHPLPTPHLKVLRVRGHIWTSEFARALPPCLNQLSVCTPYCIPSAVMQELPRSIRHLDVVWEEGQELDCLDFLPPSLTVLILRVPYQSRDPMIELTPAVVSVLPSTLTRLCAMPRTKVLPGALAKLPRGLRALQLRKSCVNPDEFGDLPQGIETLALGVDVPLEDRHIALLPRRALSAVDLRSAQDPPQAHSSLLTPAAIQFMPPRTAPDTVTLVGGADILALWKKTWR